MTAPDELLALAERALEHAGPEAQATVTAERSLLTRFARSAPTQATAVEGTDVEILCVCDGQTASAATTRLDPGSLRTAARTARSAAEALAADGPGAYPGLPAPAPPAPAHAGFDAATAALDPGTAGAALAAAFAAAQARGLEAFGAWSAGAVTTAVASTAGLREADAVTDAFLKVIARDTAGRSGFAARTAVAAADIDPKAVAGDAVAKVDGAAPADLPPGAYPVVLDHAAVGTLLEFLGWLAFNGLAHAEGQGALCGRLGTAVAAPAITIADVPGGPGTLPRAFDAEGVPKLALPLIEGGVARRVVHDTRSAALAGNGAESTGHATAAGGGEEGPVPTNLVLAGGDAAGIDALAAPIERGIYVTRLWYVNPVLPQEALLTGTTRDGTFLIEDGRITRPLRDVRFTDSALRILAATEALTGGRRLVSEGDFYGRRFAHGVVCPALRAGGFRVTGSTD